MLDSNGDPLLMDFGLARFQEGMEKLTHVGAVKSNRVPFGLLSTSARGHRYAD